MRLASKTQSRHRLWFAICRGQPIPGVEYTAEETVTWGTALRELAQLYPRAACREFLASFPAFHFSPQRVPQLQDLSQVFTLLYPAFDLFTKPCIVEDDTYCSPMALLNFRRQTRTIFAQRTCC